LRRWGRYVKRKSGTNFDQANKESFEAEIQAETLTQWSGKDHVP
jgi:hypothetical protein